MIHDWFSHGRGASPDKIEPYQIPIDEDDPFPQKPLIVPRTPPDSTRSPADEGKPPTFLNVETHWWDASQIYGSSDETVARVRRNPATGEPAADGKIHLAPDVCCRAKPQQCTARQGRSSSPASMATGGSGCPRCTRCSPASIT
jgi:hypothetical protein